MTRSSYTATQSWASWPWQPVSRPSMPSVRGRKRFPSLTRGELAQMLPAGLQRDGTNVVTKDPNREVQERLSLVFASFLELGSVAR
jgi:hypothetical protein